MQLLPRHWPALAALALAALGAACQGYPEMQQPTFGREAVQRNYENGKINYYQYVQQMKVLDPNFVPPPQGRTTPSQSNPNNLVPPPQPQGR